MKAKNNVLGNIKYVKGLIKEFDRKIIPFNMFRNALEKGFYSFFFVYFIKIIYDMIEGRQNYVSLSVFLGAVCLTQIIIYITSNQYDYYVQIHTPVIVQGIYLRIFKRANQMPLEKVENPEYYGKYTRALDNAQNSIMQMISLMGDVFGQSVRLLLLVAITISIDPFLLLLPLGCIVNSVIVSTIRSRVEFRQRKELSEYERKCAYCKRVFYEKKYSQELRLYKVGRTIASLYDDSVDKQVDVKKKYLFKLSALEIWDKMVLRLCLLVVACIYLSYKVMVQKSLTIGSFAGAMAAISNISYCMGFLTYYIGELFKHGEDCQNLIIFLETEETGPVEEKREVSGKLETIEARGLTYSYPESDKTVLRDVLFEVKKGEKIAIVGFNGAGKTTLVKLILGLYKNYEGNIFWNGKPVREIEPNSYKKKINSVLQDFCVYELSVAQNVAMSSEIDDRQKIKESLRLSGIWEKISKLPHGMDNVVTKELDAEGANFSGGELQKIAVARVFYDDEAELTIMDEPTSAMDPISEFNVYKNVFDHFRDRTLLFISHRLLTCTMADRIFMMERGRIIEQGSHEELMKLNGKYAEMYRIQASKVNFAGES